MKLTDLQEEYKEFFEYVHLTHSILYDLTIRTNEYLVFYNRLKNHGEKLSCAIEENLLIFQFLLNSMDNIIESIDNIYFMQLKLTQKIAEKNKSICSSYNYEYEKDIYVDMNQQLNLFGNIIYFKQIHK